MNRSAVRGVALLAAAVVSAFGWPLPASATLVGVEFKDELSSLPPGRGGSHWKGIVDADAGLLSIFYWEELPGGESEPLWRPVVSQQSPWVFEARRLDPSDPSGVRISVPDGFLTGGSVAIGDDWGFISTREVRQIDWLAPDGADQPGDQTNWEPATFDPDDALPSLLVRLGWGAFSVSTGAEGEGFELRKDFIPPSGTLDETAFPLVPNGPTSFGNAVGATVTTFDPASLGVGVSAVPEPSVARAMGLVTLAAIGWPRRRDRGKSRRPVVSRNAAA